MFGENTKLASNVGIIMMVLVSISNGVQSVLTRMMQSIHVNIMMVYIAIISLICMTIALLTESAVKGQPIRILNYTEEQYRYGFATGSFNIGTLLCKIIAY